MLYNSLITEKRFNTAHKVQASWRSFKNFISWKKDGLSIERRQLLCNGPNHIEHTVSFCFEDIDDRLLKSYRHYMIERGCSEVTIGMYLYPLRELFQKALKDEIICVEHNPFLNIKIGGGQRSKAVLYPVQLKQLWEYTPAGVREHRAKAFFFFCYLCNGMNFRDMALLKWKNVHGDMLTFVRQKTKTTLKTIKPIRVYLHEEERRIIEELSSTAKAPDDFIFPWFNDCRDAKHLNATINRHKRVTNRTLTQIGKKLNFDVHVTISLARHSFATKHKLDGTPVAFISEMLGHSATEVTEHYLKSLPAENLKQMTSKLLNF
jgi:integrase